MTLKEITTFKFVTGIELQVFWDVTPCSVPIGYQVIPLSSG
jgi:hypothetical protein